MCEFDRVKEVKRRRREASCSKLALECCLGRVGLSVEAGVSGARLSLSMSESSNLGSRHTAPERASFCSAARWSVPSIVLNLNHSVFNPDWKRGDRLVSRRRQGFAGLDGEPGTVPGTDNLIAFNFASG